MAVDGPVLVAVADDQPAILDFAVREAARQGCGLRLVRAYAVPPAPVTAMAGVDIPASYRAGAQDVLDAAVRQVSGRGEQVAIESALVKGHTPTVLERESERARLIVIGPAARKPWYVKMFEGEVTHHLVERAACPVVVVPKDWRELAPGAPVVVVVDGHLAPLDFAARRAASSGAPLRVLLLDPVEDAEVTARVTRYGDLEVRIERVTSEPRELALRAADGAALLVLSRPDERHLPLGLVDSIGQDVVVAAQCPVAVVPAEWSA